MESLIHADIFFFVTTVIAIVLGIVLAVIFVYIAKILADIREISRIARIETGEIAGDIREIRKEVHDEFKKNSSIIVSIMHIMKGFFRRRKARVYKK